MASTFATVMDSRQLDAGLYIGGQVVKLGASPNSLQVCAAGTDKPAGILQRTPDVGLDGTVDNGTIVLQGPATALAGAAVATDDDVVLNVAPVTVLGQSIVGTLVPKSGAGYVLGKAISPAAAGEYFELVVNIRKEPA